MSIKPKACVATAILGEATQYSSRARQILARAHSPSAKDIPLSRMTDIASPLAVAQLSYAEVRACQLANTLIYSTIVIGERRTCNNVDLIRPLVSRFCFF